MLRPMQGTSIASLLVSRTLLSGGLVVAALVGSAALGGCVNRNIAAETVTWQAADDLDCPPSDIKIQELRINLYYANGCGSGRQYQVSGPCTEDSDCSAGDVRGMGKGVGP